VIKSGVPEKGIPLFLLLCAGRFARPPLSGRLSRDRRPTRRLLWTLYMKTELICSLTEHFEAHAQQANSGVEFWLARDLQHPLGMRSGKTSSKL
jgi:hypothetical protein